MSEEPPAKRVRKGAKSCNECRHRKVRCVWLSEAAEICQGCSVRGRTCELQVLMTTTANAVKSTSRARIGQLEGEVSSLWAVVRNLESKLGNVSTEAAAMRAPSWNNHVQDDRPASHDSDSDSSEASEPSPPGHLLQLFDNGLLGSNNTDGAALPRRHAQTLHRTEGSSALWALMPSREDMLIITAQASMWLSLCNALFPMVYVSSSSDEMLLQYDKLQAGGGDTLGIAALLISVAMTVQQAPDDIAVKSIVNTYAFVKQVSDTVERIVVSDDVLAGTLEGLETALLFVRLQLGRGSVRKLWLLLRRVIALAQLLGLPRAASALASQRDVVTSNGSTMTPEAICSLGGTQRQKASLWETICAIDRITSMTWSLPLATADCPPPKGPIADTEGRFVPRFYLYSLADIASRVLELDNAYACGRPLSELFSTVMSADQELRLLASLAPKGWWRMRLSEFTVDSLLQHWHYYLSMRLHLQLALKSDEDQHYAFNFITCLEACQELARRYTALRPILPTGFFGNPVLDLQVFSAAVFLLLASYRTRHAYGTTMQAVNMSLATTLIDQVVRTMESVAERTGGDFARQAVGAVRSLSALLEQPQTSKLQKITLHLPLVGKINVCRKIHAVNGSATASHLTPGQPTMESWQPNASDISRLAPTTTPSGLTNFGLMDSLSYSMEVPEAYPFLNDEAFGSEEWLTWTGWDGVT